ncbi:MAG TPA: hypothetical protein VLR26_01345 [Frankiaceae bacterium]|nr:hypothetical protein [Frankiaceae bacterium]
MTDRAALMAKRVGISPDLDHQHGQDTIDVAVGLDDNVLPHHYAPVSAFLRSGWA